MFVAGLKPEHDGCLSFMYNGKEWVIGLYSAPSTPPEYDFSKIALKYGGGGHKQACGFRVDVLPFLPIISERIAFRMVAGMFENTEVAE